MINGISGVNPNIKINETKYSSEKKTPVKTSTVHSDVFVSSSEKNHSVSFTGLFKTLFSSKPKKVKSSVVEYDPTVSKYANKLAHDVNVKFKLKNKIPAKNFESIVTADEFRKMLPSFSSDNFDATEENIKKGMYCVDLDNISNFSTGSDNLSQIFDKAALYANEYYNETGKDFIFALTDRDTLKSVQHAVKIIASDPVKYKHVKFVPGIKMSFAHKAPHSSDLGYANSEMLVYGIDPFSKNLNEFIDKLVQNRMNMITDFFSKIVELYPDEDYNINEFMSQNGLTFSNDYTKSNLYWRIREYAEKGGSNVTGENLSEGDIISAGDDIIASLYMVLQGSKPDDEKIASKGTNFNEALTEIFEEYATPYGTVEGDETYAETLYSKMIDCLAKEKTKPVLALCAPYYYTHYYEASKDSKTFDNVINFVKELQDNSKGMLVAFESVVPQYGLDKQLGQDTVDKFNECLRSSDKVNLYEVGGSFYKVKPNFMPGA